MHNLDTPPSIVRLLNRTWSTHTKDRPSAAALLKELKELEHSLTPSEREWLDAPDGHPIASCFAPGNEANARAPANASGNAPANASGSGNAKLQPGARLAYSSEPASPPRQSPRDHQPPPLDSSSAYAPKTVSPLAAQAPFPAKEQSDLAARQQPTNGNSIVDQLSSAVSFLTKSVRSAKNGRASPVPPPKP